MAVSFFDMFFDSDARQRADLNDAARVAADARFYGDLALENIDQLRQQVLAQREQLAGLSTAIKVLVKMLAEAGAVDDKILRYRVEAEVEAALEAAKPGAQRVACLRCQTDVVAAQTSMTEDGAVCDRCMAGA